MLLEFLELFVKGEMSRSCTPGTAGHRLRSKNLDTINSLQRQTAGELSTQCQIWFHHS
jgi:hypothetical protein